MAEYFYYFGFIYLLHNIIALYDVLTFKKFESVIDEALPVDITPDSSIEERVEAIQKSKRDLWKQLPMFLVLIISWIWVISGTQIAKEPNVFLGLIFFALASNVSALIYAIIWMARNKTEYLNTIVQSLKGGMKFVGTGAPNTKALNVIDRLIRISVVSYILYIHLI